MSASGSFVLFHYDAPAGFWLHFHYISSLTSSDSPSWPDGILLFFTSWSHSVNHIIFFPPYFIFRYQWVTVLCFERIFQKENSRASLNQPKWPRHPRLNCVKKEEKVGEVDGRATREQTTMFNEPTEMKFCNYTHTRRQRRRDEEEIDCRLLAHHTVMQLIHSCLLGNTVLINFWLPAERSRFSKYLDKNVDKCTTAARDSLGLGKI